MSALVLLLALSFAAREPLPWPAPPQVAETAPPMRPAETARVRYVTADRAFFDRGLRDGLRAGEAVELTRAGAPIARCELDSVTDAWASCRASGARVGDHLRYVAGPGPKPVAVPPAVQPASTASLAQSRAAITSAPFPLIASKAGAEARHPLHASAALQHETWVMIERPKTGFDAESIHLQIAGAELGAGFRLYVDASAYQWTRRPSTFRAPDRDESQLYVSDLEVAQRELGRSWVLAAGRVWAYRAAGLGVFDGAQVGWRSRDGALEAGAFGGAVPDPVTLAPSGTSPIAGAYAAFLHTSREGLLRWLDLEAHAAVLPRSDADTRVQVETLGRLWLGPLDLAGDVQLAPTGSEHVLEGVRLSLAGDPVRALHLVLDARYDALPSDVLTLPGENGAGHRSRRADLVATWTATSALTLGLDAGHVRDLDTELWHGFLGPRLGLPRLFGSGGLLLGYLEEAGDSPGRSAFLQADLSPARRFYLLARASWFEDRPRDAPDARFDELGLYLHGDWHFTRVFWLRLSALGRLDLTHAEESTDQPVPLGLDATLAIGGDL